MTGSEPQPPKPLELPFHPALPIVTERLVLRACEPGDFVALLAYHSQPEVVRFVPFPPRSPEAMRTALDLKLAATTLRAEGENLALAVLSHDDVLVGDLVLILRSVADRCVEIGYMFDPRYAGAGYATEAVRALISLAFGSLGARRVVARVDERNTSSRRLCERIGMRQEAFLRENEWFKGEWTNEVDYGLLASEWPPAPT